jgi:hypothetical protein
VPPESSSSAAPVAAPPDFVGVGTEGSGTDWWAGLLGAHPAVAAAPVETRFFDRFWQGECGDADIAAYHALFARRPGSTAGEWSPGYILDPWTPPLLRRAAPAARLLVLLRDPVERFGAAVAAGAPDGAGRPGASRAAANAAFARGLYADQLVRLWRVFPREAVLVLQLERCVAEPEVELSRTFAFLGLDPAPAGVIAAGAGPGPAAAPAMRGGQRSTLVAAYAPENARLARLLRDDLDPALWASAP